MKIWLLFFLACNMLLFRVTTHLENLEYLEKSGNFKVVRKKSGKMKKVREKSGKTIISYCTLNSILCRSLHLVFDTSDIAPIPTPILSLDSSDDISTTEIFNFSLGLEWGYIGERF